jgi:hypothetical protein
MPQIPKDAIKIGRHSYYLFTDEVTQAQAVEECRKRGGYLARITEQAEFAALHAKLVPLRRELRFWVDGTDARKEGLWTLLDGTPLPPLPWNPQEPDNGFPGENGLGLAVFQSQNGRWVTGMNDLDVSTRRGFICEWDEIK